MEDSVDVDHTPPLMNRRTQAEKVLDLHNYFSKVINQPDVRNSQYVHNFVGPFQIGDISPQRGTRESWNFTDDTWLT